MQEEMYLEQKVTQLETKVSNLLDDLNELKSRLLLKQEETLLTTKQVAEKIGISRSAVLYQIRKGNLKAIRNTSDKLSRCKVAESEVLKFMS